MIRKALMLFACVTLSGCATYGYRAASGGDYYHGSPGTVYRSYGAPYGSVGYSRYGGWYGGAGYGAPYGYGTWNRYPYGYVRPPTVIVQPVPVYSGRPGYRPPQRPPQGHARPDRPGGGWHGRPDRPDRPDSGRPGRPGGNWDGRPRGDRPDRGPGAGRPDRPEGGWQRPPRADGDSRPGRPEGTRPVRLEGAGPVRVEGTSRPARSQADVVRPASRGEGRPVPGREMRQSVTRREAQP